MFRKLIRNKKAQQTAEYALLIALVVAAVIAMQTYAQRAIQSRIKVASDYMATNDGLADDGATNLNQYEPYYLSSQYNVGRGESTTIIQTNETIGRDLDQGTERESGGYQKSTYEPTDWNAGKGFE